MNGRSTEDSYGSENTLCNTIMVNVYHYTFLQTRRTYNTISKPQCIVWTLTESDVSTKCTALVERC